MRRGARKSVKKLAQFMKPRTLASANGAVMSLTKKMPVSTRNMALTMYAVGVVKKALDSFQAIAAVFFMLSPALRS